MTVAERRRDTQKRLDSLLQDRENETNPRNRAQLSSAIATCYSILGQPDSAVTYLQFALKDDPDHPQKARIESELALYRDADRSTPWDHEAAVLPYDDVEDIEKHKHLPYDEFMQTIRRGQIRKSIIDKILEIYRPGMAVLEAGCAMAGYYGVLRLFADVPRYCGVDITPLMLKRARSVYPEADFARMDIQRLGFKNDAFEIVFSTDVTMHLVGWRDALNELYRVTKNYLILRVRLLLEDKRPTLVGRLGTGAFEIPYVIHNSNEFKDSLRSLEPPLEDAEIVFDRPEVMYDHLWQIYREHPDLPLHEHQGQVSINRRFDILLVKRHPSET